MSGRFCVVFVTAPPGAPAKRVASALLKQRLAACVNIVPGLLSAFRWEGKIESAKEVLLVIKTRRALLKRLETAVRAAHPYDTPEIIALPIIGGHEPYLSWIGKETRE